MLTRQPDVEKEVKFISLSEEVWPKRDKQKNRYIFDETAGKGATVYVVDNGANLEHSVGSSEVNSPYCLLMNDSGIFTRTK